MTTENTDSALAPVQQETAAAIAATEGTDLLDMVRGGSPALQIMLVPALFEKAKVIATYLSKADGVVPRHLIGKPESCFAVVTRSLTWKLDPFAVASCTYQTPNGSIGFEGKLCQAILENSGQLIGPITFEHLGDWDKLRGMFEEKTSQKGGKYFAPTWDDALANELGLGVVVRGQVRGETEPREWTVWLIQCHPRNSTLWALDPRTQICYTAVRRFASLAAPGLFMGVPFDRDDIDPLERARDITPPPAPKREDFDPAAAGHVDPAEQYADYGNGPVTDVEDAEIADPETEEGDSEGDAGEEPDSRATDSTDAEAATKAEDASVPRYPEIERLVKKESNQAGASRWANLASAVVMEISVLDDLIDWDIEYAESLAALKALFPDKHDWLRACISQRSKELGAP